MSADTDAAPAASPELAETPPLLLADGISKRFGGLVAVSDVSFEVPRRSIVSLIGPNGAGKTTFFNMLTGLIRPSAGRVTLDGRNITRARPDVITARGMARTFQNIRLFGAMTAVENVMIGQHTRMKAGIFGAVARPPWVRAEERAAGRGPGNSSPTSGSGPPTSTGTPPSCPTGSSAGWRSPGPWRPSRSCCCSTSRPPG